MTHGRLRILADPAWGWCAGLRHPPEAEYQAGVFTPVQLDQLRADPALTLEDLDEAAETSSRAAFTGAPSPADGAATGGEGEPLAATNTDGARAAFSGATSPEAGSGTGGEGTSLAATNPEAEGAAPNSAQPNGADAPAEEGDAPAAASDTDAQAAQAQPAPQRRQAR